MALSLVGLAMEAVAAWYAAWSASLLVVPVLLLAAVTYRGVSNESNVSIERGYVFVYPKVMGTGGAGAVVRVDLQAKESQRGRGGGTGLFRRVSAEDCVRKRGNERILPVRGLWPNQAPGGVRRACCEGSRRQGLEGGLAPRPGSVSSLVHLQVGNVTPA